jgi:hypothetical protein
MCDIKLNIGINMRRKIYIIGQKFGKLTVIKEVQIKNSQRRYLCHCECGNEKEIQGCHLTNGHTTSCGCSWYKYGENNKTWKGYKEISSRFFGTIKRNAKLRNLLCDITIEECWDLFLKQNRKCALSGLPLVFEANNGKITGTASLDRIDSSIGYILDNIQWVHKDINTMKWNTHQDKFIYMCNLICKYQKNNER